MHPDAFFQVSGAEMEALRGVGERAFTLYIVLRSMMDHRTGLVGRRGAISRAGLCRELECETPKGSGTQVTRPTEKQITTAIERLIGKGLLQRVKCELLVFLMPMARVASSRPNQTGHVHGTVLSTEQGRAEASNGAGFDGIHGRPFEGEISPNGSDIKMLDVYPSQSSSTPVNGVVPGDDADARGVNRDRPAGSQAGSACCRPGKTHTEGYRDRPAASHPAPQGRRLAAGSEAGGALQDGQESISSGSSAAKESLAGELPASDTAEGLLRAVLGARGIRVDAVEPVVVAWVQAGVSPDELADAVEKSRRARIKAGSTQPIPLAYVAQVISTQRAAAKRALARMRGEAPRAARGGTSDLSALARQFGIADARPGETAEAFGARVRSEAIRRGAAGHG